MKKILFVATMVSSFISTSLHAGSFQEHFRLVRSGDGDLVEVHSRAMEKSMEQGKITFDQYARERVSELEGLSSCQGKIEDNESLEFAAGHAREIWNRSGLRLQTFLNGKSGHDLFIEVDKRIDQRFPEGVGLIARPLEPGFYIKRDIFKNILGGIVSLIRAFVPYGEILGFLEELVSGYVGLWSHYRNYERYKLVNFLVEKEAAELGISEQERRFILSSLGEWDLGMMGIFALKKIKKTWAAFGANLWQEKVNDAENRISKNEKYLKHLGEKKATFFWEGTSRKDNSGIMNFLDKRGLFLKWPSWAWRPDKPWALFAERSAYQVLYLALKLNPWGWLNSGIKWYLNKRFKSQIVTEGSLWLHAVETGDENMKKWLEFQSLNPLIITGNNFFGGKNLKNLICP